MKKSEISDRMLAVAKLADQSKLSANLMNAKTGETIEVDGDLVSATVVATLSYVHALIEEDADARSMKEPEVLTHIMQRAVKTAYFEQETA